MAPDSRPARMFFFGAWAPRNLGHFLFNEHGRTMYDVPDYPKELGPDHMDGVHAPGHRPDPNRRYYVADVDQRQNHARVVEIEGWTVLAFWDRTADTRFASNGAFIVEGHHTPLEVWEQARARFPEIIKRLEAAGPLVVLP